MNARTFDRDWRRLSFWQRVRRALRGAMATPRRYCCSCVCGSHVELDAPECYACGRNHSCRRVPS